MLDFWWVIGNHTGISLQNVHPFMFSSAFSVVSRLFLERKIIARRAVDPCKLYLSTFTCLLTSESCLPKGLPSVGQYGLLPNGG